MLYKATGNLRKPSGTTPATGGKVLARIRVAKAQEGKVTSYNWAGYVADKGGFTGVEGSWQVPALSADSPNNGAVAIWVGIGGYATRDLLQTGVLLTRGNGGLQCKTWWEALPCPGRGSRG